MWSLHRSKASFDAKSAVEHFGWLSVYAWHAHDPGYLGLICLICPNPPNINETDINQSSDGLYIWLMFHLINVSFSNTKTGINWLSDDLYISAKLHLMMWNMEFNTLDGFLCICALYLGSLGPISIICHDA